MGVYEILTNAVDFRKGGTDCDFNGYLEDYISTINESDKDYQDLNVLLAIDPEAKVCVNYAADISSTSVSNTIIRYKDIHNLLGKPLRIPYIVYTKRNNRERALLLANEYVIAKGYYYAVTETGAELEEYKNDILALGLKDSELISNAYSRLFTTRIGFIQRDVDRMMYSEYDQMYAKAKEIADHLRETIFDTLKATDNQEYVIRETVSTWFVLKKFVYVQYMVDKRNLKERHEGNMKAQRNQAKIYADNIRYISIPELRRGELFERA